VHAHGYGKCFIVRADETLFAFMELEAAIGQSRFWRRTKIVANYLLNRKWPLRYQQVLDA